MLKCAPDRVCADHFDTLMSAQGREQLYEHDGNGDEYEKDFIPYHQASSSRTRWQSPL